MREYKFEFKSNDDPDFPEHTKFYDSFNAYDDGSMSDLDEFIDEAKHFLLARGFLPTTVAGVTHIHWNTWCKPDYAGEYLVTLKGSEYATVARYDLEEETWDKDNVVAWAEMPDGAKLT